MNRDLILVAIALLTWGLGDGMFLNFHPLYLQELGADPIGIGAILGGLGTVMMLSQIPAGYLADRIGRRPLLISAWIVGGVAAWMMALAPSLPLFVAGLLVYGLTAWVVTPLNSYLTAARGRLSVGRVLTLSSAVFYAGAIAGPLLGGFIGDRWGLRYTYLVAAVIFVFSTSLILFIRPQPVERPSTGYRARDLLRNRQLIGYLGLVLFTMFALYLPQPLSPNFLKNQRAYDLTQIGQLVSIGNIGIVVFNLVVGQLPARIGYLSSQVAVGAFAYLLWRGGGWPWYMAGFFLLGGYRLSRNLVTAQARALVHSSHMGLAYGLVETTTLSSMIVASVLAGYLYSVDPALMYPASIGAILVTFLLAARFLPTSKRREARIHFSQNPSGVEEGIKFEE